MLPRLNRLCLLGLITAAQVVAAQSSDVELRHLDHAAWTTATVPALFGTFRIARSNDGYLWLSAAGGVLRFDGTSFVLFDSTTSQLLTVTRPKANIRPLLVDRAGTLWLQRPDGALLTYRDGVFRLAVARDPAFGTELAMDGAGHLYLYSQQSPTIFRIDGNRATPLQLPGFVASGVSRIVPDTGHGMWIGTSHRLWHATEGRIEPIGEPDSPAGVIPLVQTRDGTLWTTALGIGPRLHRIVGGKVYSVRAADSSEIIDAYEAVEDSSGVVWISTRGRGVLRWRRGHLETFTRHDGLTDVLVYNVSVDAEGVAYLATPSGLDRFRPTPFITLGPNDGVPIESPTRIVRDESGAFWISGSDAPIPVALRVGKTKDGRDTVYATRASLPLDDSYRLLGPARGGGIFLGTRTGELLKYRDGVVRRWTKANGLPGKPLRFALEARDGALWIIDGQLGLGVLRHDRYTAGPTGWASDLVEDSRGHLWIADPNEPVIDEVVDGRVVRQFDRRSGIRGFVGSLALERDSIVWGMSDSGLVRVADGRVANVPGFSMEFTSLYGPSLLVADEFLWLASESHITRIPLASLAAAATDTTSRVRVRDFGPEDGLAAPRRATYQMRTMVRDGAGRVWLAMPAGLAVFDVARDMEPSPPNVRIEEVSAFGRSLPVSQETSIAPNPDRVVLRFTAPNLDSPERDHFEYRLDGVDHGWIDGGAVRVASYTQLRPGTYHFQIRSWRAPNRSVFSQAHLDFRVEAAWYQLVWSRIVAALIAIAMVSGLLAHRQRRRHRLAAAQLQAQFEVRLAERTRIARELHDTLLQGFTGLVLQLEGLRRTIERRSSHASSEELSRILVQADAALLEARQSVWDMRAPDASGYRLSRLLETACRDVAATGGVAFSWSVTGTERRLPPEVESTTLYVTREALRNVVRHAHARHVRVELSFEAATLRTCIADDGVGMTPDQLELSASGGHFGIVGMRERATAAGGSLEITSVPNVGTRVELVLPCPALPSQSGSLPVHVSEKRDTIGA